MSEAEDAIKDVRLVHAGPGVMRDGKPSFAMRLEGARDLLVTMADALVTFFKGEGGVNYVEVALNHPTDGQFLLCVQRAAGKTPHELRREAEAERDALRARVAELERALSQRGANTGETQADAGKAGKR